MLSAVSPCVKCAAASAPPDLTFYQAAASVFAVLLLTGVASEIRDIRTLGGDSATPLSDALQGYLVLVAAVLLTVVAGELVSLLVLLDPPAQRWEQLTVTVFLAVSVVAVPALILLSVWAERLPELKRIAVGALAAMACVLVVGAAYLIFVSIDNPPEGRAYHVFGTCASGKCGLNERERPHTESKSVGQKRDGDDLAIVCQAVGGVVRYGDRNSIVWDRLSNGAYVADLFVDTPAVGSEIPACETGKGGALRG